jgi:hypothetical protein
MIRSDDSFAGSAFVLARSIRIAMLDLSVFMISITRRPAQGKTR